MAKAKAATPGKDIPPVPLPAAYYDLSGRIVRLHHMTRDIDDPVLAARAQAKLRALCTELQALIDATLGEVPCPLCVPTTDMARLTQFRICVRHDLPTLLVQVNSRPQAPLGLGVG